MISKQDQIEQHLLEGWSLTAKGAWQMFGHSRLASVVNRMRNKGVNIKTTLVTMKGSTFAKYKHEKAPN